MLSKIQTGVQICNFTHQPSVSVTFHRHQHDRGTGTKFLSHETQIRHFLFSFSHLFLIISSHLQSPNKGCLLRHPLPLPATPLPQSCRDLHHLHPVRSPSQPPPPSIELSIVACRGHLRRQICLVFGGKDWIFMAPLSGSTSAQPLTGTSVATFFWLVIWGF